MAVVVLLEWRLTLGRSAVFVVRKFILILNNLLSAFRSVFNTFTKVEDAEKRMDILFTTRLLLAAGFATVEYIH
jgi:hypothetical protein